MSVVDRYNEATALAALGQPFIDTRLAVTVRPGNETLRFVQDITEYTYDAGVDGILTYGPVPYAKFGNLSAGVGSVPDRATISMDANDIVMLQGTPDQLLQSVIAHDLRDRPISISLLVLNTQTKEVIGIIPRFVGFIDQAPLRRDKTKGARLEINVASYRGYANRQVARVYGDTDHESRFPGDRSLRWISSVVHRRGKYFWNSTQNGGGYTGGSYRAGFNAGNFGVGSA